MGSYLSVFSYFLHPVLWFGGCISVCNGDKCVSDLVLNETAILWHHFAYNFLILEQSFDFWLFCRVLKKLNVAELTIQLLICTFLLLTEQNRQKRYEDLYVMHCVVDVKLVCSLHSALTSYVSGCSKWSTWKCCSKSSNHF